MNDNGLVTTPATARTDTIPAVPARRVPGAGSRLVRAAGVALAAGAAAFGATFLFIGPTASGIGGRIGDLAGLAFQLGLFGLLTVMLRTRATGTSRVATGMVKVEFGLLGLASLWSLLHATTPPAVQEAIWLGVIDVFWPLSMLGMFVIAIKVAVAGRWRGVLRGYPLVAESWVVVAVPAAVILGGTIGGWVGGLHMMLGYGVLGVLLALRPQLTGATG